MAPETVPCGIYTIVSNTYGETRACGGTCTRLRERDGIVYYTCNRCGHGTARYVDGRSLPAWDGILRDGTPYVGSGVDEHDWRL